MRPSVLYVSYDGLLEPLGQSQVLQYLERLAEGADIALLTFEKPSDLADAEKLAAMKRRVASKGIHWTRLRYHKKPSLAATAFDLAVGTIIGGWICVRRRAGIVHARSYPPAVIALVLKLLLRRRFLFDMRGLWADQRVECGALRADSLAYRLAKWFERRFLTSADAVVSLTKAAISVIREFPYMRGVEPKFDVVPTCTNLELFSSAGRAVAPPQAFVLGIVGSLGLWYDFGQMIDCFARLRRLVPDSRLLVVTQSDHGLVRDAAVAAGLPPEICECVAAEFSEVPKLIARMDAALFFLTDCPSKVAVSPTKLGELLAGGVPCLVNSGVGDIDEFLEESGAGVILRDYSAEAKAEALERLVALARAPGVAERCGRAAVAHFDLARGVDTYARLYAALTHAR